MVRAHLVSVLLCALIPLQALAQAPSAPPLVPAPSASGEAPQGELIPHKMKHRPGSDPDSSRHSAEVLAGILLGSAAAFPGMKGVWDGVFNADLVHTDPALLIWGGLALTAVATPLGVTLGVMGAGALMDGEGRLLPTLAGAALGTLAGMGAGLVMGIVFVPLAFIPLIVGPVIGAYMQYEDSHAEAVARREQGASVRWIPSVGVSPEGAVVAGLAGRF